MTIISTTAGRNPSEEMEWPSWSTKESEMQYLDAICLVKAMGFPVVMYGCESWTVKKAERQRIDAFELWCWRRLLRVPWTARRSNQSILKEISPGISLEGMMLKLKLQDFGHLMRRVDSLEKTLMRSEEHTSELQSPPDLVCRLLLEKKKKKGKRRKGTNGREDGWTGMSRERTT